MAAERKPRAVAYSQYYAVEAEGHRVGLCVCKLCGAVILIGDPECASPLIHIAWHGMLPDPPKPKRGKR